MASLSQGGLFTVTEVTPNYQRINKAKLKVFHTVSQPFVGEIGNKLDVQLWQLRVELKNMARNFQDCIWILELPNFPPFNRGGFTVRDAEMIIRETNPYFVPQNVYQIVIFPHKMGPFSRGLTRFSRLILGNVLWSISPNVILTYSWEEANEEIKKILARK